MSQTELTLFHFQRCPFCEKVRRALRFFNCGYESREIDPGDRSEVLRVSGQESVPLVVDGDTTLAGSTRIIEYLDERFAGTEHLIPAEGRRRSAAYLMDRYAERAWGTLTARALKKRDRDGRPLDAEGVDSLQRKIDSETGILDEYFRYHRFAAGDEGLSLGDISVSAFLSRILALSDFTIPGRFEALYNWYDRVDARMARDSGQPAER